MTASPACYDIIKKYEGFCPDAYYCPAKIATVGWGHTRGVEIGMRVSVEMAEQLLREDVEAVERELGAILKVPVTQGQWDALVSLCFNLKGGPASLPHKAPRLWAAVMSGDKQKAASELLDINKSNGVPLPGLTARRKDEAALFLR